MRVLRTFGLLVVLWQHRSSAFVIQDSEVNVVTRGCKSLESTAPLLRLKKDLFCDYDTGVRPDHYKTVTNVTVKLMPKLMEFNGHDGTLALHSWMAIYWTDLHLTWVPSDYNGVNFIHVKTYEIWVPDISVYNSGDMSHDQNELPITECVVFSSGTVTCVPAVKYISKCNPDFTYWPYDKHKCRITLGSWSYTGEEIDFHLVGNGIHLNGYENNSVWDLKFIDAVKHVKKYKCCPNDTFPKIVYTFALSRHYSISHTSYVTPAVALMLLTLTVFWLDSRSVERMGVASVNFICHLLCIFDLHWQLPYNGVNPPNIMLFYRESLALATFALILTALLRKLQDMSMEAPTWISSTTMFVLSNRAGRFLLQNDEESKTAGEGTGVEENSDVPRSGLRTKESSWRHLAAIVEWLSFFCVILTYIIILITLMPTH
ncbi:neuronal acetylcholine receptor subunit alpha-3 [Harpegnathos saltator]|uniref:Neuronal acetylcholine receptor subunit alpha-3 n=1 Tax=Harpegnathos saltator TaxID=610380 RepID=E2C7N3_HARSA|nr:neuronal acetylcholine receptor subunit alpha-3 [Harpegnathos saltator]EFN76016.1 Neuronal acetylcholine receptor subunit alpha-3 [Harpegnathos saltator]